MDKLVRETFSAYDTNFTRPSLRIPMAQLSCLDRISNHIVMDWGYGGIAPSTERLETCDYDLVRRRCGPR